MSNKDLFNQKYFPKFERYNFNDKIVSFYHSMYHDVDGDVEFRSLVKSLHESNIEKEYFKNMLLYIQRKLYLGEPLNICLNSANEVFDIIITPCETLNEKGTELTLDDYYDVEEWTVEREDNDDPQSRQYMLCKTCDFATDNTVKFAEHKCDIEIFWSNCS